MAPTAFRQLKTETRADREQQAVIPRSGFILGEKINGETNDYLNMTNRSEDKDETIKLWKKINASLGFNRFNQFLNVFKSFQNEELDPGNKKLVIGDISDQMRIKIVNTYHQKADNLEKGNERVDFDPVFVAELRFYSEELFSK